MQGKTAAEPAGTRTSGGVEIWGKAKKEAGDRSHEPDEPGLFPHVFNHHIRREALCSHFTDEETVA